MNLAKRRLMAQLKNRAREGGAAESAEGLNDSGGSETGVDWRWLILGLGFLLSVGSWTLLSGQFVFGEGHAERPIPAFLAAYLLAWLLFVLAVLWLNGGRSPAIWFLLLVSVLARLVLFPSGLIQENDVYRYVLDGNALIRGQNPFQWSPGEIVSEARGSLRDSLESPGALQVLSRISYSYIPTVYPPAAQAAFAVGAWLGGWNWKGQRAVFLVLDLIVIALLVVLLRRTGNDPRWVLLYGWNPLVLKEITNSAHFDVLVALFLLLAVWALLENQRLHSGLRLALAGLFLALGVLGKIYPVILVPWALILIVRSGERPVRVLLFLCLIAGVVVAGWLPFLGIGWEALTEGFRAYAAQWRMNEGAFGLFDVLFHEEARAVAAAVIGIAAWIIPWHMLRRPTDERIVESAVWVLLVWFLLIPTPYPWYSVPLLALAVLSRRLTPLATIFAGAFCLYYLRFLVEYRGLGDGWWTAAKALEHSLLWGGVLWSLLRGRDVNVSNQAPDP
jgi:hypothetical protein